MSSLDEYILLRSLPTLRNQLTSGFQVTPELCYQAAKISDAEIFFCLLRHCQKVDFSVLLDIALFQDNFSIIGYLHQLIAEDYQKMSLDACCYQHIEVLQYLSSRGKMVIEDGTISLLVEERKFEALHYLTEKGFKISPRFIAFAATIKDFSLLSWLTKQRHCGDCKYSIKYEKTEEGLKLVECVVNGIAYQV